ISPAARFGRVVLLGAWALPEPMATVVMKFGFWLPSPVTAPLEAACAHRFAGVEVPPPAATPRSKVASAGVTPTPSRTRDATTRVRGRPRPNTLRATTFRIVCVTSGRGMLVQLASRRQGKKFAYER